MYSDPNELSMQDFLRLPREEQAETLQDWRLRLGINAITSAWGIRATTLYTLIHKLDLPVRTEEIQRAGRKRKNQTVSEKLDFAYHGARLKDIEGSSSTSHLGHACQKDGPVRAAIIGTHRHTRIGLKMIQVD